MPTTREFIAALDAAERQRHVFPCTATQRAYWQQQYRDACDNAVRPLLDLLDQCRNELTLRHVHLGDRGESLKCYGPEMCRIAALLAQLPPKE